MNYSISAVIPVYNSERGLKELYERLTLSLSSLCADYEIILVDDGSSDRSYEEMCVLHDRDGRVKAIRLDGNFGQQNALMCGLCYSKGDFVVTLDDDLQNPPEEAGKLIERLLEGYDAVFGIPYEKNHPLYRNFGTWLIDRLLNVVCSKPRNVGVSSYRAIKRSLVQQIIMDIPHFTYISAMILKKTANVASVPVRHDRRVYGKSNYNILKLAKLFMGLLAGYSPLRLKTSDTASSGYIVKDVRM